MHRGPGGPRGALHAFVSGQELTPRLWGRAGAVAQHQLLLLQACLAVRKRSVNFISIEACAPADSAAGPCSHPFDSGPLVPTQPHSATVWVPQIPIPLQLQLQDHDTKAHVAASSRSPGRASHREHVCSCMQAPWLKPTNAHQCKRLLLSQNA